MPERLTPELAPELAQLESELQKFSPAEANLNRERLMFQAGQAAASARPKRRWKAASAVLAISNVFLLTLLTTSHFRGSAQTPTIADKSLPPAQQPKADSAPTRRETDFERFTSFDSEQFAIIQPQHATTHRHSMQQILKTMVNDDVSPPDTFEHATGDRSPPPTNLDLLKELCPTHQQVPVRHSLDKIWQTLIFHGEVL